MVAASTLSDPQHRECARDLDSLTSRQLVLILRSRSSHCVYPDAPPVCFVSRDTLRSSMRVGGCGPMLGKGPSSEQHPVHTVALDAHEAATQ
ncbi:unnamed protein product [Phytophthora lilii]|uniref:Unnamed protein product n=1 Tax=Phytophthora lilii TaxID=2077276 RepID=A0A9W6THX7_9STRA|nr:unnamed protein product [Phytophthora lilii]